LQPPEGAATAQARSGPGLRAALRTPHKERDKRGCAYENVRHAPSVGSLNGLNGA
jgi:hypothetical protein